MKNIVEELLCQMSVCCTCSPQLEHITLNDRKLHVTCIPICLIPWLCHQKMELLREIKNFWQTITFKVAMTQYTGILISQFHVVFIKKLAN